MILPMTIISELATARIAQKRTVRDVAEAAGIHENTLRSAEDRGTANLITLQAWASALGYRVILTPADADISSATPEAM